MAGCRRTETTRQDRPKARANRAGFEPLLTANPAERARLIQTIQAQQIRTGCNAAAVGSKSRFSR